DDLGYARDEYARIVPVPEMAAIVAFFRRLAHDVPWSASLCATALLEEEVVEIARTVGKALVQHYGVRADWGAANYTVHEAIEQEESGETKKTILGHIKTAEDRRAAEAAMREMHDLLVAYAEGLARRYPTKQFATRSPIGGAPMPHYPSAHDHGQTPPTELHSFEHPAPTQGPPHG